MPDHETQPQNTPCSNNARIIPRAEHTISRADISKQALKVLYTLKDGGFDSYLVGGGVRDLLLGLHPKDYDVATEATPEQVKSLFGNCRLIGRRFRLAHVHFGRDIIEVATFRAHHASEPDGDGRMQDGRILRDNVYGDIDDDACRRDFTINALYYSIRDFSVLDFGNGMDDLRARRIRLLGDPEARYREDPVRMLRAVRFAAKLDFSIDADSADPIHELKHLLQAIPSARLFDEVLKLFFAGHAERTFELLYEFGLFQELFPQLEKCMAEDQDDAIYRLIVQALKNTDSRLAEGKSINPAFLLSVFVWPAMCRHQKKFQSHGKSAAESFHQACELVLSHQCDRIAMPRRFTSMIKEIWALQLRLEHPLRKRVISLMQQARFRAAYDFLLLRAQFDVDLQKSADWWTEFQIADEERREEMMSGLKTRARKRPARRRKRPVHHAGIESKA